MSQLKAVIKLQNVQRHLEKAQTIFLEKHDEWKIAIQEAPIPSNEVRVLREQLQEQVLRVAQRMKSVKSKIIDSPSSAHQLQLELHDIQKEIGNVKQAATGCLQDLQAMELQLNEEVLYYSHKASEWNSSTAFAAAAPPPPPSLPPATSEALTDDQPEIKQYNKFLQLKQHLGGWSSDDHAVFLRLKTKHKNGAKMAAALHTIFPDKSLEDIAEHNRWHESCEDLRKRTKDAIQRWRRMRQERVREHTAPMRDDQPPPQPTAKQRTESAQQQQQQLHEWRLRKQVERKAAQEARRLESERAKSIDLQRRAQHEENRQKLEKWRAEKQAERQQLLDKQRQQELDAKALNVMLAQNFIRTFQAQDELFLRRREIQRITKQKAADNNKCVKHVNKAERNPARLLQATKSWCARAKQERHIDFGYSTLTLSNIQRLKQPDWRRNN